MLAAALLTGNALSIYFTTYSVPGAVFGGISTGLGLFFGLY
ncbi:hypothetical protein Vsou_15210 [Vulcanisaeta souniana JCM 11219]|uniref:Uncharacterized protein n=1 Tax=Vulcanisaeta souniana JCM 11219 TaxID=1293586 RepID=A0ABN6SSH5_9CREN|nr:hypothetical protein Vsou_15210 [Vulcanisaeta souniana JCM 11219]